LVTIHTIFKKTIKTGKCFRFYINPATIIIACGGMDNMCTVYDLNNRDSNGAAKMVRELLGYEGFLSSCRFVDDKTLITGSGDMKM
jgi:guanine nucleotide-binding protein subunit beta